MTSKVLAAGQLNARQKKNVFSCEGLSVDIVNSSCAF